MLLSNILQLPEKTWTPDVDPVMATLTVVGQYSTDQYGFKQPIQLKDDSGVSSEVVCQSKYEKGLMAPNMVGIRARWRLKWYQGGQKQVIVGYCLDKMDTPAQTVSPMAAPQMAVPQPQVAAPQAAQTPSVAPQSPNAPQARDYDAENRGKCRYGIVCAYISAGVDPDIPTVDYWVDYAMTGQAPVPPGKPIQPTEEGWEH
jgi:hypothetical protein